MTSTFPTAAWHPDPSGQYAQRYWNGAAWTEHVIDRSGQRTVDPAMAAPTAPTAPTAPRPAFNETAETMALLEARMVEYSKLIESAGPDTDEADLARRALRVGLVVREMDACILDAPSGRWFRYDGVSLTPVGGWSTRPPAR